jgi:biopolymer transport protein ExbD
MKIVRKHVRHTGIPTASLPDIIFMLLIFFMVATVIKVHQGLNVRLPDAEMVKKIPLSRDHISIIWIDRNNNVVFNDVKIKDTKALRNTIYEKRSLDPQLIIAMKIDQAAEMDYVIRVQQEMREASALNVNYSAIPSGGL